MTDNAEVETVSKEHLSRATETPFYAEMVGQVTIRSILDAAERCSESDRCSKAPNGQPLPYAVEVLAPALNQECH